MGLDELRNPGPRPIVLGYIATLPGFSQARVTEEAGSVAQNIYVQSESLGLGTVLIGAFQDERVKEALNLPGDEDPLVIMPIGRKR